MPASVLEALRIVTRKKIRPCQRVDRIRPSILDYGLRGDVYLVPVGSGLLALRCNYNTLVHIPSTSLDVQSLNHLLHQLRHASPRKRQR